MNKKGIPLTNEFGDSWKRENIRYPIAPANPQPQSP